MNFLSINLCSQQPQIQTKPRTPIQHHKKTTLIPLPPPPPPTPTQTQMNLNPSSQISTITTHHTKPTTRSHQNTSLLNNPRNSNPQTQNKLFSNTKKNQNIFPIFNFFFSLFKL
ncbi:hypothetical protein AAZX31_20G160300 [Glycine max]